MSDKVNGTKDYYGARQLGMDSVNYDPVGMNKSGACAACNWFVSPNGCVLVMGDISPTGLCALFLKKQPYVEEPIPVSIIEDYSKEVDTNEDIEVENVKVKELSWWDKLLGRGEVGEKKIGFSIKQVGDDTRFYLRVSNNFEDRESQTFTLAAHKEYIAWADKENAYPELWVWHASKSRIGQADLLDLSNGILVASGVIDEDKKELSPIKNIEELADETVANVETIPAKADQEVETPEFNRIQNASLESQKTDFLY